MLFAVLTGVSYSQTKSVKIKQIQKQVKTGESVFMDEIAKARSFAPNGVVRCATTEYTNARRINGKAVSEKAFEDWLAPKIEEIKRLRLANELPSVIRIPVVVHVLHNGDAVGTGENIADGQVLSQITVFNQDFRKLPGTPGDGIGVDTTIEFCLAQVDPNGNPTNGIDRVNTGVASYTLMAAVEAAKAATFWDPTKYLNMWTVRFGGAMASLLGYAQFPTGSGLSGFEDDPCIDTTGGGGDATTDGVVCNFATWGSSTLYPAGAFSPPYDKGRTMTHEVGHMFGLFHTFQGGCAGENYTSGDYCADTPAVANSNGGCSFVDSCPTGGPDMIQNYMDYTNDSCMNTFTQDQKDRMLAVLMNSPRRDDLLVSTVCNPSMPYIQFKRQACEQRPQSSSVEGNGCSYTGFTVPLSIDKAPSANAVVTFSVAGTSVANANDIEFVTPTLTFNAGSTADQNLVFRVLNDNYVEADEELVITFTVNANGGDALKNPSEMDIYKLTILNDDAALATTIVGQQIFYDGFETYADFTLGNVGGWTTYDLDGDVTFGDDTYDFPGEEYTGSFIVFNPSATTPSAAGGGYDAHSGNKGYYCYNSTGNVSGTVRNNDYAITPRLNLGTNSQLKFWAKSLTDNYNGGERFRVEISTTDTNPASFALISPSPYTVPPLAWTEYTYDLSAYNNQSIYIAIHVVSEDEFVFMLDDVSVISDVTYTAQTDVDVATPGENSLNGTGLASFVDAAVLGKIIANVVVNDASNYGCTTASVSRSGTGAVQYAGFANPSDYAMSKQFTITPSNVVAGSTSITFYFTEAEILGWESATGNTRSQLRVIKDGASQEAAASATIGSFGSDVTITANFATGVDGVFSFVAQSVLAAESFEIKDLSIYPNPNNGTFNLAFASTSNDVVINVHDIRGRLILNKRFTANGLINETIELNDAQSGIYLVTIQNGSRKVTKKIVVE